MHIYGPQVIVASNTFCAEPTSKIAKETFENFCEMWRFLVSDVVQVAKDILESFKSYPPSKGGVNSIQNLSAQNSEHFFPNHVNHFTMGPMIQHGYRSRTNHCDGSMYSPDINSQQHRINNMPMRSHPHYPMHDRGPPDGVPYRNETVWGGEGYGQYRQGGYVPDNGIRSGMATAHEILDTFKEVGDDNEILKHARGMLASAQSMQSFTRGEGKIKTTQDFFTKAESLSEFSNKLYKLVRMFSYTVPTGEDKRILMQAADHIPRHCGQMQLLIQLPGVGKESTFRKVDSIIKENNQIMYLTAKVVQLCFMNAKKYELDFRGITLSNSSGDGTDASSTFGASSGGAGGSSSHLDSGIGFGSSRRGGPPAAGAGGNKRTRVSFLLY